MSLLPARKHFRLPAFGFFTVNLCASLLAALAFTSPAPAHAQPFAGTIRLAGGDGDFCYVLDNIAGIQTFRVYHGFNPGTVSSRFKIVADPGVTMTYLSETVNVGSSVGNTQDGIVLCYGSCQSGTTLLLTVSYVTAGTSQNCSQIRIVPYPGAETVDAIRCNNELVGSYIEDLYVQSTLSGCGCPPAHIFSGNPQEFTCQPVPTASTTWGAIKAFYAK